jgi:hypothetical protein
VTAVHESIENWIVAADILRQTLDAVRPMGRSGKEAGAFWLGSRDRTARISLIVLLHGSGIEERPGRWAVAPAVFGVVTRWAKPRNLCLLGVVHIHLRGVPPVLSWSDRNLGVRFPGMLSVIIGNGGEDLDHRDWGWHLFEDGDYRPLTQGEVRDRVRIDSEIEFEAWTADANAVQQLKV